MYKSKHCYTNIKFNSVNKVAVYNIETVHYQNRGMIRVGVSDLSGYRGTPLDRYSCTLSYMSQET